MTAGKRRVFGATFKAKVALAAATGDRTTAQFTATAYTSRLKKSGVAISMDGRGRALDNMIVERVWRTV